MMPLVTLAPLIFAELCRTHVYSVPQDAGPRADSVFLWRILEYVDDVHFAVYTSRAHSRLRPLTLGTHVVHRHEHAR